jgi:hypothetical protein
VTDERPKPKYGELAPEGWVWKPPADPAHDETPDAPAQPGASGAPSSWPAPRGPQLGAPVPPPAPGAPPGARSGQGDRIATIVLLALGVLGTVNMVTSLLTLPAVMQELMGIYGVSGVYAGDDAARTAGIVGAALVVPIYAFTVLISLRRLRANKLTFFVPLIGAVVAFTVNTIVVLIALQADPAVFDAISRMSL